VSVAGSGRLATAGAAECFPKEIRRRVSELAKEYRMPISRRETWKQLHPSTKPPGVVALAIDEDAPAVVVKSVVQTSAYAGYPDVSFAVGGHRRSL
jgi:hypothetical protein